MTDGHRVSRRVAAINGPPEVFKTEDPYHMSFRYSRNIDIGSSHSHALGSAASLWESLGPLGHLRKSSTQSFQDRSGPHT